MDGWMALLLYSWLAVSNKQVVVYSGLDQQAAEQSCVSAWPKAQWHERPAVFVWRLCLVRCLWHASCCLNSYTWTSSSAGRVFYVIMDSTMRSRLCAARHNVGNCRIEIRWVCFYYLSHTLFNFCSSSSFFNSFPINLWRS